MAHETRSIGLSFLLSLLLVAGVAFAGKTLFAPTSDTALTACQQRYSFACLI